MFVVEARGFSFGLWMFWDLTQVHVNILAYNAQTISLVVLKEEQSWWSLIVVYASPTTSI